MKVYIPSLVLLLAQLALADHVININNATDKALAIVNKMMTDRGLGLYKIPIIDDDDIWMSNGVNVGLNSQYRTGDATVDVSEDSTSSNSTVDLHLGTRLYNLGFGLIKMNGEEMSGVFRVKNNSFHISFDVLKVQGKCFVKLHNFEYERLTEATFDSSLEKYTGVDVSDVFSNTVLPRINKELEGKKHFVEQIIQRGACFNPHLNFHETNYFAQVLSSHLQI